MNKRRHQIIFEYIDNMNPTPFLASILVLCIGCTAPKPFLDEYTTDAKFISKIGNQSSHTFRGFDLDKKSKIYISGTTFATVETCNEKFNSGHAGLLMKMDPDLSCTWALAFEGKKDRATCFLREAFVDQAGDILVSGICHGELHLDGKKQFDANGKFQSFIAKLDEAGQLKWLNRYLTDKDYIITDVIQSNATTYAAIGIQGENLTIVFELDTAGNASSPKEYRDPGKIFNNILLKRGGKYFQSSIGQQFVTIRELDNQLTEDWKFEQKTGAALLTSKVHIGMDIQNGLWISVPFLTGNEDFVFGKDKIKGTGLYDSYLVQFKNRQQGHSFHISGSSDQIVTGLFDGNKNRLSLCISHGQDFGIDKTSYNKGSGISLLEFDARKPEKLVYSTFPIENKERDRITNTGVYFKHKQGKFNYLGGFFIKGESQTTNPKMTVGSKTLEIVNPVFNSFIIKGTKKR